MPVVPSGSTVSGLVEAVELTAKASEIIGTSGGRVDSNIVVFCRPSGLLITWVQKPAKRRRSRAISRAGVGT